MEKKFIHCCALCKSAKVKKIFTTKNQHGRHVLDAQDTFDVFSCAECGGTFLEKLNIDTRYYKKYYEEGYYESGNGNRSIIQKFIDLLTKWSVNKKQQLIFRHLGGENRIAILDVGCGAGEFLSRLDNIKFIKNGVEINPEAVRICKERGLEIYNQNLLDIDLFDKKFDVITMWHVLEHIHNPIETLVKIRSMLSNRGVLIFEIPNIDSFGYKYGRENWFHMDSPRHLILYNKKSVTKLCTLTGFRIKAIKSIMTDYPLDLFWSIKKSKIRYLFYPFYPIVKWLSQETLIFVCEPQIKH